MGARWLELTYWRTSSHDLLNFRSIQTFFISFGFDFAALAFNSEETDCHAEKGSVFAQNGKHDAVLLHCKQESTSTMTTDKKLLVVGNWKMNLNVHQSSLLVHRLHERIASHRDVEVILAPSMLALQPISLELDRRRFRLCAQDAYHKDEGPYTGEVSFAMLSDLVHYALVGHSARRLYFGEDLDMVCVKVQAAVRNNIEPIICVGETKTERDAGETKQVLHDQIVTALSNLTSRDIEHVVIAYEPIWAISTFDGMVAKPHEAQEAIEYIRLQVRELYGDKAARDMRVIYGGSVNEHDVKSYLEVPGVDGVLVGAASLNYVQFAAIVAIAHQIQTTKKVTS